VLSDWRRRRVCSKEKQLGEKGGGRRGWFRRSKRRMMR
jgi:hypothetical protein